MLKVVLSLIMLTFGSFAIAAKNQTEQSRPNVLFIAVDDLKPVLGCYGNKQVITPHIDKIATRGTVFLNSHCQWPVCGPSRASLMSSLRPEANGVMNLKTDIRAKNRDILTLPQHFKNNGYITAGTGKIYDPRCVDSKKKQDTPSWSLPYTQLNYGRLKFKGVKKVTLSPDVTDENLADGQIAISGVKLLRKLSQSKQPFFLACGFKKPHLPFIAPKKYWDMYKREQFSLAKHQSGIKNNSGYSLHDSGEFRGYEGVPKSGIISDQLQRKSIHGYYACVSYIDAQIGLLLKELKTLGLEENTIIVLWGDHGFHLGDHGMWGKHSTLEQAARVPLIICPPTGLSSFKSISKTNAPVELIDIYPTLCELANLPLPQQLNGRSLVSLLNGETQEVRKGAITVFKKKGCIGYSYRTERYRYTEWINKKNKRVAAELYDYETDPLETINLIDDDQQKTLIQKLANNLRNEAQGCQRLSASDK